MTLLPRSLFGRLALLLLAVVAIALAATILFFRQDRAALLARQFGDTKIVQLQTLRAALEGADAPGQRETLARIGRQYGARIIPETERPQVGLPVGSAPGLLELEARLRETLGEETDLRIAPGRGLLFVRIAAGGAGYWVGFPLPPRPQAEDVPSRAAIWSATLALVLLAAAFVFARYLARPLRELDAAVGRVGRGEMPPPLPEQGPSEIANVNRGFNRMVAQLTQAEDDRALLLAGVSHDLRTPLARMRLAVELGGRDEALKAAMVDDIEEMDRIIGQFLDFARGDQTTAFESRLPDPLVAAAVDRYARAGSDIRFAAGGAPALPLKATAFARLVTNLIDNSMKYGAPPVEVTTRVDGDRFVLEVADRGPGVDPADVARLKQPFTRANAARSSAPGGAGAGLGLAIVERIARLHGGSFDLLPRDGGGALARVRLPLAAAADPPAGAATAG